ncbi:aminoglycoside 6-adenylyltransferase [Nocardia sp. CA-128927]|uniref:aminoglycoside 6-adenylyltransferase n=1 Tax=Nocardia sp. CA-128927 TaxID=3239975 RepID=UPI003D97F316
MNRPGAEARYEAARIRFELDAAERATNSLSAQDPSGSIVIMDDSVMAVAGDEPIVGRVVEWARGRDDVRVVLRTGSRARGDGAVDALSDHDIELFTTDVELYLGEDGWVRELGGGVGECRVGRAV